MQKTNWRNLTESTLCMSGSAFPFCILHFAFFIPYPARMKSRHVFVTGGTGYLGGALVPRLVERGHTVRALVRPGSTGKLSPGCVPVPGNALEGATFADAIAPADTFVQLVGVAHFVYVSVAQPAPVMKAYQAVRAEAESLLRASGLNATILRPWYILGPGHRWPVLMKPLYWLCERLPATRDGARRTGLVTLPQMAAALVQAVENPRSGVRIVEAPEIRTATLAP